MRKGEERIPAAGTGRGKGGTGLKLSGRMQAVADMVAEGNRVCDVGCDHGFVSIYLVWKGVSPSAVAMDVNEGPLQAAGEHIGEFGLGHYIETRLSDGLEALRAGEADTLICAGMGGRLIRRIMAEGKEKVLAMKELILQPQSEIQALREYLREEGYLIVDETMIFEEGKYYPVIKGLPGKKAEAQTGKKTGADKEAKAGREAGADTKTEEETGIHAADRQRVEDKYGPILLKKKNPVLKAYLHREAVLCMQIIENLRVNGKGKEKRQEEIADRIKDIKTALSYYQA